MTKTLTPPPSTRPLVRRALPVVTSLALAASAGCVVGEDAVGQVVVYIDGGSEPGDDAGNINIVVTE